MGPYALKNSIPILHNVILFQDLGQEVRENIVFLDNQIQELRQQLLGS